MLLKGISLFFLGIGVFMLVQVAMPFLAFKAWEISAYDKSQMLIDPNPVSNLGIDSRVLGVSIENIDDFPALIANDMVRNDLPYREFKLSVPSMKLEKVKVAVASNNFEDSPSSLPGTAMPGEKGNVFISAHSSLPNKLLSQGKKPYFVNLPSVKKGDSIIVEAVGNKYEYIVQGIRIVDPKEVWVINPPDAQGRYLTLMTCVPPGFNTKRLVVLAKLKEK